MNANTERQYSIQTLWHAFTHVQNKDDWKAPIYKVLDPTKVDMELIRQAIVHYTATKPTFTGMRSGRILVEAPGYRQGPAGDH